MLTWTLSPIIVLVKTKHWCGTRSCVLAGRPLPLRGGVSIGETNITVTTPINLRNLLCGSLVSAVVNLRNSKQSKRDVFVAWSFSDLRVRTVQSELYCCFSRTKMYFAMSRDSLTQKPGNTAGLHVIKEQTATVLLLIHSVFQNVCVSVHCLCLPLCSWPWRLHLASLSATWWTQQKSLLAVSWWTPW